MRTDPPARGLLVMDVDSTLLTGEVIEMLAARAGAEREVAAVTARAMAGDLDFAESLHARVATLAGLPIGVVDEVRADLELSPGATELLAAVAARGWATGLVSGGFVEVIAPLADSLGVRHLRANRLEQADGRLTGRVSGPVIDARAKEVALREWAAAEGLRPEQVVAVGDGANDLLMVTAAGLGVGYRPKPVLAAAADLVLRSSLAELIDHLDDVPALR